MTYAHEKATTPAGSDVYPIMTPGNEKSDVADTPRVIKATHCLVMESRQNMDGNVVNLDKVSDKKMQK